MNILCIGHAAYDITIKVPSFPTENIKYRIDNRVECGGGPASNAAYLLAKWGMKTYFAGVVGNDLYGNRIKEEFDTIGVNTKYLQLNDEQKTTSAFILANQENGSRTVFACLPSSDKMKDIELDFEPDIILIDGHEPEVSKKIIEKYRNAISIIDAGRPTDEIIELCKLVDYVACSKTFAEEISGLKINYTYTNTIVESYNILKEKFNNNIIITLEEKGCVYSMNGAIKIMPSIKVKPIDTTGAGDIFHGTLAYCLASHFELEKSLKYSNIAGALSVLKIGGRFSIPELKEVEVKYEEFK
ncbi:MAG: PfkB family carbohydrate kinase [Bacilli bacterium]